MAFLVALHLGLTLRFKHMAENRRTHTQVRQPGHAAPQWHQRPLEHQCQHSWCDSPETLPVLEPTTEGCLNKPHQEGHLEARIRAHGGRTKIPGNTASKLPQRKGISQGTEVRRGQPTWDPSGTFTGGTLDMFKYPCGPRGRPQWFTRSPWRRDPKGRPGQLGVGGLKVYFHLDICPACMSQHYPHKQSFQNGGPREKSGRRGSGLGWFGLFSHPMNSAGPPRRLHRFFFPLGTPRLLPRISVANSWAHLFLWPGKLPLIPPLPLSQLPLALLEVRQHSTAHFETDLFPNCPPFTSKIPVTERAGRRNYTCACVRPACGLPNHRSNTSSSDPSGKPSSHQERGAEIHGGPGACTQPQKGPGPPPVDPKGRQRPSRRPPL